MVRGLHLGAVLAQKYGFKSVGQHVQCLKLLMGILRQSLEFPDHEFPYNAPTILALFFFPDMHFLNKGTRSRKQEFVVSPYFLSICPFHCETTRQREDPEDKQNSTKHLYLPSLC